MYLVKFVGDNYYKIVKSVKKGAVKNSAKWGSSYYEVEIILESDNRPYLEEEKRKLEVDPEILEVQPDVKTSKNNEETGNISELTNSKEMDSSTAVSAVDGNNDVVIQVNVEDTETIWEPIDSEGIFESTSAGGNHDVKTSKNNEETGNISELTNSKEMDSSTALSAVDGNNDTYAAWASEPVRRGTSYDDDSVSELQDSDADYIPSDGDLSSDISEHTKEDNDKNDGSKNITNQSTDFSLSDSINKENTCAPDDQNMYVSKSQGPSGRGKKNFCFYCHKMQSKISRHLETVHSKENDVMKFSVLPKNTLERKKIIDLIRKKGNFYFNTTNGVNHGELLVSRRPSEQLKKTASDYTTCYNCRGFFTKNSIRHHRAKCVEHKPNDRQIMVMGRKLIGRIHPSASSILRKMVFPVLREDEAVRVIRYDALLITFANKMCLKYRHQHQYDMIRSRLRLLGRFLIALKQVNKAVTDFASIYNPSVYDSCIQAVNTVAVLDEDTQMYKTPTVASTLGTLLKQVGTYFITCCIKTNEVEKQRNAENFLKLLVDDYTVSVNKAAVETLAQNKRQKKVILPSTDDIRKLNDYLKEKRRSAFVDLQKQFSLENWRILAETTLISLQLFNRRRPGETERVLIQDFQNFESVTDNDQDIFKSLSSDAQGAAKKYVRVTCRGKLMRTVPMLLHVEVKDCIQLILQFRQQAGVSKKNPYVFGLPSTDKRCFKYLRACELIRKFSRDCGAAVPISLRGTTLRKHIATRCITLELNDTEVSDLANFMGHAERIHKEHYRQPLVAREITRISRLLELAQGGQENVSSSEDEEEEEEPGSDKAERNSLQDLSSSSSTGVAKKKRSTSPYGKTKRIRWDREEIEAAVQHFQGYLNSNEKRMPSLREIQNLQEKTPRLRRRTPAQIKTWLHNCKNQKMKNASAY
ncbi:unnamed protein product [Callosobruchus maculatus]|uniref:Uncharacterized protein n=1 Tax=Callosobruchus maculatus TaxID=64391 RepID=A0A653CTH6_CALMS|nr:unnamed protein product [Callosobruchus maculatus]